MAYVDAQLLAMLRAAAVHLPAGDLAQHAGVPLSTVAERMGELRAAGFDIELRPGYGYRLVAAPDRLIADDLTARLGDCAAIREIVVFEETGSTNDVASQAGRRGAEGGLAIFAERQTAGRGRFGRRWESASHKGLWFSLLLRPELPLAHWTRLTTWTVVALASALEQHVRAKVDIKWPNDCFVNGRKVAGILIEAGHSLTQEPFAVIGIGVNVNHEPDDFPPELAETATSLAIIEGEPVDRVALAATILRELSHRLPALNDGFAAIVAEAERRNFLIGRWIQVQVGGSVVEGMAEALDEQGQLLLRREDGECQPLNAGEVTLRIG
jgi:BirA family biotin operon repressor/biotin-[acetyl-CoA-carboxylase] ligase